MNSYTSAEVAKELNLGLKTIYNYIRYGQLKAIRIGGKYRIQKEELERFLREGVTADYKNNFKKKQSDEKQTV